MSTAILAAPRKRESTVIPSRESVGAWATIAAAFAFAASYFQLFVFPKFPIVPWGDPVLFLENARRIIAGQLPYRDYLQFTTPGTELFYALLIRVFKANAWIPCLTMAILAAVATLFITLIAARLFSGAAALVPALLFSGFVLPNSLYATHHWFSTVAVLAAAWLLIDDATIRKLLIAGAFCGVAGFFTQTRMVGAVLALAIFLFLEGRQTRYWRHYWIGCSALLLSTGITFVVANIYFVRAAGLSRFVFCTIIFPVRYYPAEPYNTWRVYGATPASNPGVMHVIGICFVYALVPTAYLAWFLYRRQHTAPDETVRRIEWLMALVGIGMFLGIVNAPSLLRLCAASPPALILLACMVRDRRGSYVVGAAAVISILLAVGIPLATQMHRDVLLDTPTGRIAFSNADRYEEFQWVSARTTPGQAFFGQPPLSFALDLCNPTPVNFATTSDFTRPSEVAALVRGLDQSRTPLLVLSPMEYVPETNASGNRSDHMQPFRDFLFANYRVEHRFSTGDEAWVRKGVSFQPELPH